MKLLIIDIMVEKNIYSLFKKCSEHLWTDTVAFNPRSGGSV
jgi:hypothetical protein